MTSRTPRRRPSASLVISMLALFVALGGTGVAQDVVADISAKIKGKRIAKNAITSKHIKNGTIKDVDVKANTFLTPAAGNAAFQPKGNYQPAGNYLAADGKAVDSDKLDGIDSAGFLAADGKAADADLLDGVNSSEFMRGAFTSDRTTVAQDGAEQTLLTPPDSPSLKVSCSGGTPESRLDRGGTTYNEGFRDNGAFLQHVPFDGADVLDSTATGHTQYQVGDRTGTGFFTFDAVTVYDVIAGADGTTCHFTARATRQSFSNLQIIAPIKK